MIRAVLALWLIVAGGCERRGDRIDLAVAASLRHALPALISAYTEGAPDQAINVRYGASGELATLVRDGGDFDGVILADAASIDSLVVAGKIAERSQRPIARNSLVLVAREKLPDLRFDTLDHVPEGITVAIGDPATVSVGRYAERMLRSMGKWQAFQSHALLGGDVAAVVAMVQRGDVDAGIVYATDAVAAPALIVLDRADPVHSPPARVVAAPIRGADGDANEFFTFALSPRGQEILRGNGFSPP